MSEPDLNSMVTDFGNEQRMLRLYPGVFLFDGINESWYVWDDQKGIWKKDEQGKMQELAKEMIRNIKAEGEYLDSEANLIDDSNDEGKKEKESKKGIAAALLKWANRCQTPARIDACLKLLQSSVSILPYDFNKDAHRFNCKNGTLDLNTMQLLPHNRDHRITMTCGWEFDPQAKCPKFEAFISRLFEHHPDKADLIKFVQMSLGYALSGDIDKQVINMHTGTGSNGKSVLMSTFAASFGDYAGSLNGESLTTLSRGKIREDLAQLEGKRFVHVSETPKGTMVDEDTVKRITGGSREALKVRSLYGHLFDLYPKCKLFWSFNHAPSVNDFSHGMWRRIKMVPFEETIEGAEVRPMNEIIKEHDDERSGILNWLIKGYQNLMEIKNFNWCEAVKKRTGEYKEDVDTLAPFFDEVTERWNQSEHPNELMPTNFKVKAGTLYDIYLGWAFTHGYYRNLNMTKFGNEVTERIGRENKEKGGGGSGVHYIGLKIREGQDYPNPKKMQMSKLFDDAKEKKEASRIAQVIAAQSN